MRTRALWTTAMALALWGSAHAAEPACRGTVSGAVAGTFRCAVEARQDEGHLALTITALDPVGEAQSFSPGGFEVPAPARPGTYTLATLGPSRIAIISKAGTLYSATRTTRARGEARLVLSRLAPQAAPPTLAVHGTLTAVLKPSGSPATDEVRLEVTF
jgi:hypothetical protein